MDALSSLPWASVALPDRLGAMVEAMVISDRWATHRRGAPDLADGSWRRALLAAGDLCDRGQGSSSVLWGPLVQGLASPAAVALVTLPYLWQQADTYGHYRSALESWVAELGLSPAAEIACIGLFQLFCTGISEAGRVTAGQMSGVPGVEASNDWEDGLTAAIALVAQSQGQLTTALRLGERRCWSGASLALVGLLVGWVGGRASLGAALRQRWLVEPQPVATDPWQGLEATELDRFIVVLYGRWAGVGPGAGVGLGCRL